MKRWIVRLVLLLLLVGVVAFLWIRKPWPGQATSIAYQSVAVSKGPISAQVTANGTLSARSTTEVGAQVSGRVLEIHVDFNDRVRKGQLLAKLDEQVLKAQIDQAQAAHDLAIANRQKAEVALSDARRQYTRQKTLQEQQLVSGAALEAAEVTRDNATASLAAAQAQVKQAAANLKQTRTNLSYATIYSPVDGVVLSRSVEVGQTVAASLQAPVLFKIAEDLTRMQIDTAVAEADIGRLRDGMKATFTVDAFPGKAFEGVVRQVRNAPTTSSGVVTYDAVIDLDNKELVLRPGMTANVTFVLEHVADAVRIPNAALRFKLSPDQIATLFRDRMPGASGSGDRVRLAMSGGSGGGMGAGLGPPGGGPPPGDGPPGGLGGAMPARGPRTRDPDRKVLWKLVDNQPQPIVVKIGLTDGSHTQLLEGEIQPGDQLITEVSGLPSSTMPRRIGAF